MQRLTVYFLRLTSCACAILTLFGCESRYAYPTEYSVTIDPNLRPDAQLAVAMAVNDWQRAVPVKLQLFVEPCHDAAQEICVTSGPDLGYVVASTDLLSDTSSRIVLRLGYLDSVGASMEQAAEHELGHAMGLMHDKPGTLMAAEVLDQAEAPTADDVRRWGELR